MAETQTDREPGTGIRSLDGAETVTRVLHATITITMIGTITSTIHMIPARGPQTQVFF